MPERELEGLRREMEKLMHHLADNEDVLDGAVGLSETYGLLSGLLEGHTADALITSYGLEVEDGV